MKKAAKIFGVAAAGLFAALLVALLLIDSIAEAAVEKGATQALGVETSLDRMSLAVFAGSCALLGLQVSNPPAFESPYFLRLGDGEVAVSLGSLLGDQVVVPKLELRGIDLYLEQGSGGSNFGTILGNLDKGEAAASQEPSGGGRRFVIRELVIRDVRVRASLGLGGLRAGQVELTLPEIRLENVGSDSGAGVLLPQLVGRIVRALLAAALEKGSGRLPDEILGSLKTGLRGLGRVHLEGAADELKGVGDLLKKKKDKQ